MTLDYESYSDWGEAQPGGNRSPRRKPGGWRGDPRQVEKSNPSPVSRIETKLASFDTTKNDPPEKVESKRLAKEAYLNWVGKVLSQENVYDAIMEPEDLQISERNSGQLINVRHVPSGFYAHGIGSAPADKRTMFAKDELFQILDGHIRDWQSVSPEYRAEKGVVVTNSA